MAINKNVINISTAEKHQKAVAVERRKIYDRIGMMCAVK